MDGSIFSYSGTLSSGSPKKLILIVEDDLKLSRLYAKMLQKTRAQIFTASSSDEAIRVIERLSFDLIFLDLNLHDSSGLDVLDHLKQKNQLSSKLIVMSADDSALRDPLVELADLTLIKPIHASLLLQFAERFLA